MATLTTKNEISLAQQIAAKCGENANLCYSCKRCSSGCPLADYMDLTPAELMRAVQLGQTDRVLNSKTMWLCSYCETCFTRCPHGIDIPSIMDSLKQIAKERGIKPRLPSVAAFNDLALRWMRWSGRVFELGLMGELNLRTGQIFKDADLGLKLFRAGKLKLLPERVSYKKPHARKAPQAESDPKRIAYYPGCSQHSSEHEYDMSIRAVAPKLGLQLIDPEGWTCCGAGAAHTQSRELAAVMPMRTIAQVEAEGETKLTTPCPACYSRLRTALHQIETDPAFKQKVDAELGYTYEGGVEVSNLVSTFAKDVGLDAIGAAVTKPLKDLKVVCYYGCLFSRPPVVTGDEHAEYPVAMDQIVKKLGATVIDWSYKTDCCGASLMLTQTDIAMDLTQKLLDKAVEVGAEAIVVACSFCQGNLDQRQEQIERRSGKRFNLPIIYFTQLMGLAMGLSPKEVGLHKLFVNPAPLLKDKNLIE